METLYSSLPTVNKIEFIGNKEDGFIHLTEQNNKFKINITISGLDDLSRFNFYRLFFDLIYTPSNDPARDNYLTKDFVSSNIVELKGKIAAFQDFTIEFNVDRKRFIQLKKLNKQREHNRLGSIKDPFSLEVRGTQKHDGEMGIGMSLESGKFLEMNAPVTLDYSGDII